MSNIWKMYVFRFLRDFYLIVPIIVPFYQHFGFNSTQILLIQSVFSLSLLLFEIPSGYFSDILGRRLTLIIGAAALPLGLALYAFGVSFPQFIIAEAVLGFAFAMCSGTESALIYDTLLQHKKVKDYHRIEGRAEFITRIGSMTAAVAGGALAVKALVLPFYVNIISGILMFLVAVQFIEPHRKKLQEAKVLAGILRIVKYCLNHRQIAALMLLYAILLTTGLVSIWGYLIKLQQSGWSYYVNGYGFAFFQVASALGALSSHRLSKILGRKNSYRFLLLIPIILFLQSCGGQGLLLLAFPQAFIWGFSLPFFLKEINYLIHSEIRATVLSTGSMFGRLLFVIVAPLTGFLFDKINLNVGFIFLGLLFLIFAYVAKKLHKIN